MILFVFLANQLQSLPLSHHLLCKNFLLNCPLIVYLFLADMVYGDNMSLGTNVGDKGGNVPLWDVMDREAWKKQIYYSLQRWRIYCHDVIKLLKKRFSSEDFEEMTMLHQFLKNNFNLYSTLLYPIVSHVFSFYLVFFLFFPFCLSFDFTISAHESAYFLSF